MGLYIDFLYYKWKCMFWNGMVFDALMLLKQVSALHVLLYKMMVLLSWVKVGERILTFGTFWCQRVLFCCLFFVLLMMPKYSFFLSCGKTALFLKSKSRASALKGENLPIRLALCCAILGRRTQPAPAIAENGGLSLEQCVFSPWGTHFFAHTNTKTHIHSPP